jgi:hypothetical protein
MWPSFFFDVVSGDPCSLLFVWLYEGAPQRITVHSSTMATDDTHQLPSARSISPLFEPQKQDEPTPDPRMNSTETTEGSPYVLELRKIKTDVEARLAEIIDSKAGLTTTGGSAASSVPAKRKGWFR